MSATQTIAREITPVHDGHSLSQAITVASEDDEDNGQVGHDGTSLSQAITVSDDSDHSGSSNSEDASSQGSDDSGGESEGSSVAGDQSNATPAPPPPPPPPPPPAPPVVVNTQRPRVDDIIEPSHGIPTMPMRLTFELLGHRRFYVVTRGLFIGVFTDSLTAEDAFNGAVNAERQLYKDQSSAISAFNRAMRKGRLSFAERR
ncbi:hypothetical protein CYLTODRAFT_495452, partial [Cylindrobasidium torrendii FP15055 ss-10]